MKGMVDRNSPRLELESEKRRRLDGAILGDFASGGG